MKVICNGYKNCDETHCYHSQIHDFEPECNESLDDIQGKCYCRINALRKEKLEKLNEKLHM